MSCRSGAELERWPALLPYLVQCLDSGQPLAVDGALNALAKICEDIPERLDSETLGRPLNVVLPKLLAFFGHPELTWRKSAIGAVNQFLLTMPTALTANMDVCESLCGNVCVCVCVCVCVDIRIRTDSKKGKQT